MEAIKDSLIDSIIEGSICLLPSHIKLLKLNTQWKREFYSICRDEQQLHWLTNEFKIPLIIDYIVIDLC